MKDIPLKPENDNAIATEYSARRARMIIERLKERNMRGYFFTHIADARRKCLELIPDNAVVSQGGSMTLDETGIRQALIQSKRFRFSDPYASGLTPDERFERRRKGLLADVFVCSTNAITFDGILVNRDGIGNRVCAMAFGPPKVIVVAGLNKVVADIPAAVRRIDTIAAPMNCIRLNRKTPCYHNLECSECTTNDRICSVTTIIERQWVADRLHVILIGKNLGY